MGHCSRVAVRCILFEIKVITANVNVPAGIKNTSKLHVKREGHYIYIHEIRIEQRFQHSLLHSEILIVH